MHLSLADSGIDRTQPNLPVEDVFDSCMELLKRLQTSNEQLHVVSQLYQVCALTASTVVIPSDYLQLSVEAMSHLKDLGRTNVLYNLAKVIGTKRANSSESRLPVGRMPMGLLEHCINFFLSAKVTFYYLM